MQMKMSRFSGQVLLLQDPNNLEESVGNKFEAMVIEPKDILRWEDDGGQIILPLDYPSRLYS